MSIMPYRGNDRGVPMEVDDGGDDGFQVSTSLIRAEMDSQIATAKRYPRSIEKAKKDAQTIACLNEKTAASCIYAVPRAGKTIDGPSVRLAEIVANAWGNNRVAARISEEGATHITAQAIAMDLEKNTGVQIEVRRRITNRDGKRFNDDMIATTGNAALSIAFRNAVFKMIPAALIQPIYEAARLASLGKEQTVEIMRSKMLDFWAKKGVAVADVFRVLEVRGIDDITVEDLIKMRGLANALSDGETTLRDIFPPLAPTPEQAQAQAKATLGETLKGRRTSTPPVDPPVSQEPPADANAEPPFDMKG